MPLPSSSSSRPDRRIMPIALAAAFVSLVAATHPASADARYVKVVNIAPGHVLWLRSGPALHFERIGLLPHGTRHVRMYTCRRMGTDHWCQVRYRGIRGWASQRYLAKDSTRVARQPRPDEPEHSAG